MSTKQTQEKVGMPRFELADPPEAGPRILGGPKKGKKDSACGIPDCGTTLKGSVIVCVKLDGLNVWVHRSCVEQCFSVDSEATTAGSTRPDGEAATQNQRCGGESPAPPPLDEPNPQHTTHDGIFLVPRSCSAGGALAPRGTNQNYQPVFDSL
eukprot:4760655-Pyramimonas_sp.AAC.1